MVSEVRELRSVGCRGFALGCLGADQCINHIVAERLNHDLHAIDATPARWRAPGGLSPLDSVSTVAFSPWKDLVKNSGAPDSLVDLRTGAFLFEPFWKTVENIMMYSPAPYSQ